VIKLRRLIRERFLGRVLSVRLEFGYWVFEGDGFPAQRPSWNYRAEDGGGIVLDMFPHWQYLLEDLFGPVSAVYARRATHLPRRWDEAGKPYDVTADDAVYAVLEFASGFKAQWERFLRAAARDEPFQWDLFAGARGVQLAELAMRSCDEGRRVEIPE